MSKPKSHETEFKPKNSGSAGDCQNGRTPEQHEKTVAEISMKDFLDFLKISYQVNEAIDNPALDVTEKGSVDWKKLTSDNLINRLKEREALLNKQKIEQLNSESQQNPTNASCIGKTDKCIFSNCNTINSTTKNSDENLLGQKSAVEKTEYTSCESLISSTASGDRKSEKQSLGRKKNNGFKKESSNESETSRSFDSADERTPSRQLKKKMNEALQEGILDSVLPYILPKPITNENSQTLMKKTFGYDFKKHLEKPKGSREKVELRMKYFGNNEIHERNEKDVEIVIHVCDEIQNIKKDFRCSQGLLLSQMGYFAEVTTGQKLEDMDISVHCDVTIFDWLMQWIQKDGVNKELWPILDPTIAVPVLMSSAFLQINSLHEYCLHYCKTYINDIIRDSSNLNCINDNVLSRLASLFSNTDVEIIVDKKDRIQSKLFCKLIVALTDPEPQPSRGHYSSLATIYRCSKCLKLILKNKSSSVQCVASNMKMDRYGTVHATHVYDSSWNLSDYIKDLKASLKTWRKVYWKLWADCHLLFCQSCEEYFSVGQLSWCRFHIDSVQYFPLENQRSVFHSIGRYPCCGERVYRFEVVKKNSGCQYRDHIVISRNSNDNEILKIWDQHKDVIKSNPPNINEIDKYKPSKTNPEADISKKNSTREGFWWEGLEIAPLRQPRGLLNKVWETVIKKDDTKNAAGINNLENKNTKLSVSRGLGAQRSSIQELSSFSDSSDDSCSSSNAGNSEESCHAPNISAKTKTLNFHGFCVSNRLSYVRKEKKRRKKKKKKHISAKSDGNRFWLSKLSTRCNQDNQREFEERALRQLECFLAKKLSGDSLRGTGNRGSNQTVPMGGSYVKLEQEWREAHCFSHGCPGSSIKARGSLSHTNINNNNFSVHKRSKSRGHR